MSPLTEAARSRDAPKEQGRHLQKRWVPRLCAGQAPVSPGLLGTRAEVPAPATLRASQVTALDFVSLQ